MSYIVFPVCVIKSCQLCQDYDITYVVIKGFRARFICSDCKDREVYKDPEYNSELWHGEILPSGTSVNLLDVLQNLRSQ